MIQHIPIEKFTLTGRLFASANNGEINRWFPLKCIISMGMDLGIYLLATIISYRFLAWAFFTPTERGFSCADPYIREKYYENTVPTLVLLAITLAGPFVIIFVADFLSRARKESKDMTLVFYHSTHIYLDYVVSFWLATLAIDVVKCLVGRTRPNFIEMCVPKELQEVCENDPNGFVPVAHCTANWRSSRNSKLSFPSGHAFAAVFCTLFLFFYLRGVQKKHPGDAILKIFFWAVNCISAVFTIYCCITRITDCWHFPTDVLGGLMIGTLLFHIFLHKYYKIFPQ